MLTKEQIFNNYDNIKKLGEGCFGEAFLCKSKSDGKLYVIKTVSLESMKEDLEQKAINEGNILRQVSKEIDHPNIVKFYGSTICQYDSVFVLILEYVDGGNLNDKIEEEKLWRRKFEEKQIVTWLKELASALKYCHGKNVLHRDLKPENILLTKDNHIKLADFGVSKLLSRTMPSTKTKIGDNSYISPEIFMEKEYTFSTDIWSLGVVILELCLQQHPQRKYHLKDGQFYAGKIPKLDDKDYSTELSELIAKMLSFSPEERPTTDEIIQVCDSILNKSNFGYQGEMVNGKKEGKGTYTFPNGDKYEGEWKNNKMEGKGIYYYKNGDKYDGEWLGGKKNGKGIFLFSNGNKYEGDWVQSKMEGKGIQYYNNGDKYEGEWKNNKKEGNGVYYYSNGNKYDGEWKDDKKNGKGTFYSIKKGVWKDNVFQNN